MSKIHSDTLQQIKDIREAAIRANPVDLGKDHECLVCKNRFCTCDNRTHNPEDGTVNPRIIRLADVLLVGSLNKKTGGPWYYDNFVTPVVDLWNLKLPFESQPPKTISFIHSLLSKI